MPLTFVLLVLSIVAVWLPAIPRAPAAAIAAWPVLYAAAIVAGLAEEFLSWPALIGIVGFAAITWALLHTPQRGARFVIVVLAGLLALALALHIVPGFDNPTLGVNLRTAPDAWRVR
jgi:uncharacterized protein